MKTFHALRDRYRRRLAKLDAWTERIMYQPGRYDESKAPLAPRSGIVRNPTLRQIRENDLPRYIDADGNVRTIEQDEDGNWG